MNNAFPGMDRILEKGLWLIIAENKREASVLGVIPEGYSFSHFHFDTQAALLLKLHFRARASSQNNAKPLLIPTALNELTCLCIVNKGLSIPALWLPQSVSAFQKAVEEPNASGLVFSIQVKN